MAAIAIYTGRVQMDGWVWVGIPVLSISSTYVYIPPLFLILRWTGFTESDGDVLMTDK